MRMLRWAVALAVPFLVAGCGPPLDFGADVETTSPTREHVDLCRSVMHLNPSMTIRMRCRATTKGSMQRAVLRSVLIVGPLLFLMGCQPDSRSESFDGLSPEERSLYQHIEAELSTYRQGEPLGQFLARLRIQDAPFDTLYTNMPGHEDRLYQLGKYFVRTDVEDRDGKLYTGHLLPALHVDGLTREQRMQEFDEALGDYLKERREGLESTRRDASTRRK